MTLAITVLKFGSSILRSPDHLSDAVHEIYRYLRNGQRVIAVVSAFEGETNRLIRSAERYGPGPEAHALATLAATGEQSAAAQMAMALVKFGIPSRLVDPREIAFTATGSPLEADPCHLNSDVLIEYFTSASVVVLPGFFATDAHGRCVLLGRGGSDQSALFVAAALSAECVLLKDVQGIYDHDPTDAGRPTHRFDQISWPEAIGVAGRLIQPRALQFARERSQRFRVATPGYPWLTTVGHASTSPLPVAPSQRPLRIVLLGLGTVGLGVYRELSRRPDLFEVRRIAVRHPAKHIAAGIDPHLLTSDVLAAIAEPEDLVIELMGGNQPAASAIQCALVTGRAVVTANKGLIDSQVEAFEQIANCSGGSLRYSASVGGAVPMIEAVSRLQRQAAAEGNCITSLRGVVNGTCNFILGELENGASLEDAVALAQAKGFSEQDPSSDLSGADAAAKLRILARSALGGKSPPPVLFSGIDEFTSNRARTARLAGRRLKLLAKFYRGSAEPLLQVSLAEVTADEWLADCNGEGNALEIEMADGSIHRIYGRGAGRFPTTASVIADVYDVWRGFIGDSARSSEAVT